MTRNVTPDGAGVMELPFLNTAADPSLGKVIYAARCSRCHGSEGKGVKKESSEEWLYPPVWGPESYNTAAGLFRLSRLAGYVKVNMPYGVRADRTELTVEEAWHVAAFINSQPRSVRHFSSDWPDIRTKPVDHQKEAEAIEAKARPEKSVVKIEERVAKVVPVSKKLSYKLQYELDHLPQRMQALEEEINSLEDTLSDSDLYARDPVTFQNSSRRLGQAREELEQAETRWLELEEMKSALA